MKPAGRGTELRTLPVRYLLLVVCTLAALPAWSQLAEPDEGGIRYGHVHLNVSDVARHKALWMKHFNAVEADRGSLAAVAMPNTLILFSQADPQGGSRDSVLHHYGVKVRDIADFLADWRADGLEVGPEFIGAEGQRNAYVMMPDGVYVELQEDQALATEISGYHVHFFTPRFREQMAWYTEMFGLEVRPRGSIETTTNVPGMNISFGGADAERAPSRGYAIDHIGFEIDNLEAFCEALAAKGAEFSVPYREIESLGIAVAFLNDPAGGTIELTEGLDTFPAYSETP